MASLPASWTDWILVLAAAWLGVSLAMELCAWHAHRLGRIQAPPPFRAPTVEPTAARARLCFLGDLQRGIADVARPLAQALRDRPADLLVSSGDFVAHAEAPYYGTLFDAFCAAGVETPTRVVPGNHDLFPRRVRDPEAGYALFESRIGPRYWAERVGPVLVAGLDDAVVPFTGAQRTWLERTLQEAADRPWIAVCHRPPRRVDLEAAPPEGDLAELVALLESRPPLLVVCGHQHAFRDRVVNGVRYVVNAFGGDVHGLGLRRDPFELLRVDVGSEGPPNVEVVRARRRPWWRVYANQLAVRCWWSRRRPGGALLAWPAATLLGALGLRAPLT